MESDEKPSACDYEPADIDRGNSASRRRGIARSRDAHRSWMPARPRQSLGKSRGRGYAHLVFTPASACRNSDIADLALSCQWTTQRIPLYFP